ncbi:MAG: hypothetical protein ACREF9_17050, partial [Opitutaceae bacterium]
RPTSSARSHGQDAHATPIRLTSLSITPKSQLHGTKSGQVRAGFADAEFVFDATAARLKEVEAARVALRTYEALRTIEVLGEWPELKRDDVRFYAEGRTGIHAKLAGGTRAEGRRMRVAGRPCRACCVILTSMNCE